jgi:hypothetical protein
MIFLKEVVAVKYEAKVKTHIEVPHDRRVVLDHVQLTERDYSAHKFVQFCTIGCRLEKCRFTGTTITDAQLGSGLEMSDFIDCTFDGSRLIGLGGRSRFVRCSFREIDGAHWIFNQAELIDCTFTGRLRKAIFSGTVPAQFRADVKRDRNEFYGNDFSGMDLVDVTFRAGIDLVRQRLPSGPDFLYLKNPRQIIDKAMAQAGAWPESKDRRTAFAILSGLSDEVNAGQQQLLLRRDSYLGIKTLSRKGVEKAFALLAGDLQ